MRKGGKNLWFCQSRAVNSWPAHRCTLPELELDGCEEHRVREILCCKLKQAAVRWARRTTQQLAGVQAERTGLSCGVLGSLSGRWEPSVTMSEQGVCEPEAQGAVPAWLEAPEIACTHTTQGGLWARWPGGDSLGQSGACHPHLDSSGLRIGTVMRRWQRCAQPTCCLSFSEGSWAS